MRKVSILFFVLCILLFLSSCVFKPSVVPSIDESISNQTVESEEPESAASTTSTMPDPTEETTEPAEETTVIETTIVEPLPTYTLPGTNAALPPQTDPLSAFSYAATLPQGYFAVLPGEGNQYFLYDEFGHLKRMFRYATDEGSWALGGVMDLATVNNYADPNGTLQTAAETEEYKGTYYKEIPGAYITRDSETGILRIFNSKDRLIYEYKNDDPDNGWVETASDSNDKETAVFFQTWVWSESGSTYDITVLFISTNGEITKEYTFNDLTAKPKQIISQDYILLGSYDGPCTINNKEGEEVMTGVNGIDQGLSAITMEAVINMNLYGYFEMGGEIYDASLSKVANGTLDENGDMIPGVVYDVNGISATASAEYYYMLDNVCRVIAVGKSDNRTVIKNNNGQYEIISENGTYVCSNNYVVVMNEMEKLKVYDLASGQYLMDIEQNQVEAAPDYLMAYGYDSTGNSVGETIIDKEGKKRYVSSEETLLPTNGEYLFVMRGPYTGITDLDGNWLLRSLTWEHTRDATYEYRY